MKTRRVYSTPDLITARAAIQAARDAGVHDEDISLVARPDIEVGHIPNRRKEADSDFVPAALRGALFGGLAGLLAGAICVLVFPSIGISWSAAGLVALAGVRFGDIIVRVNGVATPTFEKFLAAGETHLSNLEFEVFRNGKMMRLRTGNIAAAHG